jgi:inner membrane protein
MQAATHLAFAGLVGVIAAGFDAPPGVAGGAALAVGSLLPDVDTTTSGVGKFVPFSAWLEQRYGHRTITHSLLGLLCLAVVTSPLMLLDPGVWVWLLVGAASHLILDTANVMGVPLLWPHPLQFWLVGNRALRVPYGSPKEFGFMGCFAALALVLMPLSSDGFAPWLHRFIGAPYSATADYLRWRDDYEVWAEVTGHNLITNEAVTGRYRIIDALNPETLLLEDAAGRAYSAGTGDGVNIHLSRVTAWRGERITSSVYRVDLEGRLVADLIASLPEGARAVRVNAELRVTGPLERQFHVGHFARVRGEGEVLELRAARPADLAPLSHGVIAQGSAVIRAEYAPGAAALAHLSVARSAQYRSHVLTIPDLPGLSGLVVAVGDEVEAGELIARYVDDEALSASREAADAARERIPEIEAEMERERQSHEGRMSELRQTRDEARAKLERVRYLVERDAMPRARLIEAEAELRRAEAAVVAERTAWTSRLAGLERSLRDARLAVARHERAERSEAEKQWVRSPVAGVVSDVRVTSVGVRGVTLTVIILTREGVSDDTASLEHPVSRATD